MAAEEDWRDEAGLPDSVLEIGESAEAAPAAAHPSRAEPPEVAQPPQPPLTGQSAWTAHHAQSPQVAPALDSTRSEQSPTQRRPTAPPRMSPVRRYFAALVVPTCLQAIFWVLYFAVPEDRDLGQVLGVAALGLFGATFYPVIFGFLTRRRPATWKIVWLVARALEIFLVGLGILKANSDGNIAAVVISALGFVVAFVWSYRTMRSADREDTTTKPPPAHPFLPEAALSSVPTPGDIIRLPLRNSRHEVEASDFNLSIRLSHSSLDPTTIRICADYDCIQHMEVGHVNGGRVRVDGLIDFRTTRGPILRIWHADRLSLSSEQLRQRPIPFDEAKMQYWELPLDNAKQVMAEIQRRKAVVDAEQQ